MQPEWSAAAHGMSSVQDEGGSGKGPLPRELAAFIAGQISFSSGLAVAYPLDTSTFLRRMVQSSGFRGAVQQRITPSCVQSRFACKQ